MSGDDFPDINAGAWYLRARPGGRWEICEPVTGEVVAEVAANPVSGEVTARGDTAAAKAGGEAVRRFLAQRDTTGTQTPPAEGTPPTP